MKRMFLSLFSLCFALAATAFAEVTVQTEHINPATPAWSFKQIPRPAKSDLAAGARVMMSGNQFEPAAALGAALVNGVLPGDSLDLSEAALLSNGNAQGGNLVIDLGRVQPVAAVMSYSWHEWDMDQGSRGPQVYALYGSAAAEPDAGNLAAWTKLVEVDTRPNQTGQQWNGQHGVSITDTTGKLGDFRYLAFALQRTRSPLQPSPNMTGTLFAEIDVHSAVTLAKAGDAAVARPANVEHVWVVFKTHLDIGYTDTIEQVLRKYRVNMMDGALKVVEASRALPSEQRFSWTLAGWPLTHVLGPQQDPARRARIEQAVREGAIAFHALPYTTHTETQDLEDLVRGLGYSTRLAQHYGRPLPIGAKMTDVPSHSWVMPTLLTHAGVKFLQLGCNGTSAFVRVPRLFWWEGPDGSRVLCNYTPDYGSGLKPPRDWPSKHYLLMEMTGDNHGPPSAADVERLRQQAAKTLPGVPVHFGTLDDFAKAVIAEQPELPVIRGDMPDTWIHGWLSMPLEAKAARHFRALEPALDALDTQLRTWGLTPGPLAPVLAEAYEQSGLFSEHTFGPWGPKGGPWESGITNRYLYGDAWKTARAQGAFKKYEAAFDDKRAFAHKAEEIVRRELSTRLDLLAKSVKVEGKRVVIYNALPWQRSGVLKVPGEPEKFIRAEDVPGNGYRSFEVEGNSSVFTHTPTTNGATATLPIGYFVVTFDLKRGGIASLVERSSGRELVDQSNPYALGQFLHERFDGQQMLAFHNAYGRPGYTWPKGNLPPGTTAAKLTPPAWKISVAETTPCGTTVALTALDTLGLAKAVTMIFTFSHEQPLVDIEWRVTDKTGDPLPEGGWLCFPFAVAQPHFLLGRLGGPIDPAKDIIAGANRHYFCLNNGLTITGADGTGIGLCPLDSPCVSLDEPGLWKFSLDYTPKKPSVFVNLYNNEWNTNFPEWQEGSWSSRVRLWPTVKGASLAQSLIVPSWEARLPLLGALADGPAGKLPPSQAGLSLSRTGVLVTAYGANPDGPGTLLRVWEQAGAAGDLTVTLPAGAHFTTARPVNLRGEKVGDPIRFADGKLALNLRAYAPASFVLE
jgi:alpha-mannosidase